MQWWNVVSTYGQLAQTLDGHLTTGLCNIKFCILLIDLVEALMVHMHDACSEASRI